jgi:hypothetical protein
MTLQPLIRTSIAGRRRRDSGSTASAAESPSSSPTSTLRWRGIVLQPDEDQASQLATLSPRLEAIRYTASATRGGTAVVRGFSGSRERRGRPRLRPDEDECRVAIAGGKQCLA